MKVAYLVNQYPKVSHSFIRREIVALEEQGVDVLRLSVRGWADQLVDDDDLRERDQTRYVLQGGAGAMLRAAWRVLRRQGVARMFDALKLALRMGWRADRALPFHLIYLAEACVVADWLSDGEVEHLHAHFGTNSTEVAMLASLLSGVPYSFTVHGPEEFDKAQFIGLGEKIRRARFVVAITSYCRSQLFRWVDISHWHKVVEAHCGLEQGFYDVPEAAYPERPRFVCVGRLCEQKGQLLLVEAAAVLAREGIDFELVLAGDGEMREAIEKKVDEHSLRDRVRITGWIDSDTVRDELLSARALVLPSFAEGLPVVIMEAMALRRPVLTTYVAGIPELVFDGEHGWLVPAGCVAALASAMKTCLDTPLARLESMGRDARSRVLERHDVRQEAAKLAAYFMHGPVTPVGDTT